MNIGIIRSKHTVSLNNSQLQQGAMPVLMTLQTQENEKYETKTFDTGFIPFVNERDKMNRLMGSDKFCTPQKKHYQYVYQSANEKWIQNDPMKLKILSKRNSVDERHTSKLVFYLDKQRSRSNADFRLKLLQANTERQNILQSQNQSIAPELDLYQKLALESILSKKKDNVSPQGSIVKNASCGNLKSLPCSSQLQQIQSKSPINKVIHIKRTSSNSKQKHFLDFKLPTLIQKEYVRQFLESNKKVRELIQEQNDAKFKFPTDFEPKILEMKLQLKKMKSKLKNWETDRAATDNQGFLKEVATGILNK